MDLDLALEIEAVPVFPSHPKNFEPIDAGEGVARGVRSPRGNPSLAPLLVFPSLLFSPLLMEGQRVLPQFQALPDGRSYLLP